MAARKEITRAYAQAYARARKKDKSAMLDEVIAVTGWSRANARRALASARVRRGPLPKVRPRKPRRPIYGPAAVAGLELVWRLMGMPSGKYLAATVTASVAALERHGELSGPRWGPAVRAQVLVMSAATMDRLLKPARDAMRIKGRSATKAGALLRSTITVRKAGDAHEQCPGFLEIDLVAHCGPTLRGEHAWTLTATDVFTGWTENVAIKNRAHRWVMAGINDIAERIPFTVTGIDCDNGGEFINHGLIAWCADRDIAMTRSRPYKSNDNAHVEQENGDVVRRNVFHYRYDTPVELGLLNELYAILRIKQNLFTATKKATGWRANAHGKKIRTYDPPRTPVDRLGADALVDQTEVYLATNPAHLTREINRIQQDLIRLAAAKTQALNQAITRARTDEARILISRAS